MAERSKSPIATDAEILSPEKGERPAKMNLPAVAAGTVSAGALGYGALALGAVAVGAFAIGGLVIGGLAINRMRGRKARIDKPGIGSIEIDGEQADRKPD